MSKTSRVRKWLIHLLGGKTKEESNPQIAIPSFHTSSYTLKTIISEQEVPEYVVRATAYEEYVAFAKEQLTIALAKMLKPDFTFEQNKIVAAIKVLENYCKGKEELK